MSTSRNAATPATIETAVLGAGQSVALRPQVASLPTYVPGARPSAAKKVHKLSSNENPYPPLPSVSAALQNCLMTFNRYPDMANTEFIAELAAFLGDRVTPEQIAVGNGSVAVLSHILEAVVNPGDEVIYPWRSFEAYPIAVAIAGGVSVQVPLDDDSAINISALAAAVTDRTKVLIVCTPNNPTGSTVTHTELLELLALVPRDVLVLVDEAYVEFVRGVDSVDGLSLLADHPNVVVLRTFSKAYGLAGLRVGYAVGEPNLVAGIRAVTTPFGISSVAQQAAVVSLKAVDELFERVEILIDERTRVVAGLQEQGWSVPESQANFVWFGLGERSLEFAKLAGEAGLLVRPFAGDGVRVSIGDAAENDAFLAFTATVSAEFAS